eukprot:6190553-Pleurochrysis_carterae.AAC.2
MTDIDTEEEHAKERRGQKTMFRQGEDEVKEHELRTKRSGEGPHRVRGVGRGREDAGTVKRTKRDVTSIGVERPRLCWHHTVVSSPLSSSNSASAASRCSGCGEKPRRYKWRACASTSALSVTRLGPMNQPPAVLTGAGSLRAPPWLLESGCW